MARRLRIIAAGGIYHVINRRVAQMPLFEMESDYRAFEKVLHEVTPLYSVQVLAYCLMPNHWHLLLRPSRADAMSGFMQRLTLTHLRRWHANRQTSGTGPVYQGRFKSFPIQEDDHLLNVARYIERNALRAKLVDRAEEWPWCSMHRRVNRLATPWLAEISDWPVPLRRDWVAWVNRPETPKELEAMHTSVNRGRPFGDSAWQQKIAKKLKLQQTLRDPWRPRKDREANKGT
jgi:putative transposase